MLVPQKALKRLRNSGEFSVLEFKSYFLLSLKEMYSK